MDFPVSSSVLLVVLCQQLQVGEQFEEAALSQLLPGVDDVRMIIHLQFNVTASSI